MTTIVGEIHLDADSTLTVLRHKDDSVSWQIDVSAVGDLTDRDDGDIVLQCQQEAAKYLAAIIEELNQE